MHEWIELEAIQLLKKSCKILITLKKIWYLEITIAVINHFEIVLCIPLRDFWAKKRITKVKLKIFNKIFFQKKIKTNEKRNNLTTNYIFTQCPSFLQGKKTLKLIEWIIQTQKGRWTKERERERKRKGERERQRENEVWVWDENWSKWSS